MATSRCIQSSLRQMHSIRLLTKASTREMTDSLLTLKTRECSTLVQTSPGQYNLLAAVLLERKPIIIQKKTDVEARYSQMISAIENEHSLSSDHEVRHKEDLLLAERANKESFDESEIDSSRQTALDLEDVWDSEAKTFKPPSTITEADKADNKKSIDGKLDEKLILIVRQKIGEKYMWVLPQTKWSEGESLRETAVNALRLSCGEGVDSVIYGNAPCGFYKYNYPKKLNKEKKGSKIFFFKAQFKTGEVSLDDKEISDYLWVTTQELPQYLQKDYLKRVNQFILDI